MEKKNLEVLSGPGGQILIAVATRDENRVLQSVEYVTVPAESNLPDLTTLVPLAAWPIDRLVLDPLIPDVNTAVPNNRRV